MSQSSSPIHASPSPADGGGGLCFSEPGSLGWCATMACVWEASAPKPGNVHRNADFEDVTYADFVNAAAAIGPIFDRAQELGIAQTVLEAVRVTRDAAGTNTNLGTLLLVAPIACGDKVSAAREAAKQIVLATTVQDTAVIYEAIRLAIPGGMGEVERGDISESAPDITLIEAMRLAADRDSIALQYINGFEQVWEAAELIETEYSAGTPLGEAIVLAHLQLMSRYADTLIARKCGAETAAESQSKAAEVLALRDGNEYEKALKGFDAWLRADEHRRNPGTTADLIAAGLFVLLVVERITCPVAFY